MLLWWRSAVLNLNRSRPPSSVSRVTRRRPRRFMLPKKATPVRQPQAVMAAMAATCTPSWCPSPP